MRLCTVLGTRPELIRLSLIIPKLDSLCEHVLVNTGQNFSQSLNDNFLKELGIRQPDYDLNMGGMPFAEQVGYLYKQMACIFEQEKPDRLLLLGDTNSSMCAWVAARMGIPVYHMEAGNRCFDEKSPEEWNRKVIDHCSSVLMPYTERSRANLLREGIPSQNIYVTGNCILEVMQFYRTLPVDKYYRQTSQLMSDLCVKKNDYFLATLHREENVDNRTRLEAILGGLGRISEEYHVPVLFSCHPRTKKRMEQYNLELSGDVRMCEPFGAMDFWNLEENARCVLTDSGVVQEECCIMQVLAVTMRDTTERPETVECGSNILSGANSQRIVDCVKVALSKTSPWKVPWEYLVENVSDTVCKIVLGK